MKIPVNRCKKLLHSIMYRDTATVRRDAQVQEEWTGATRHNYQIVYENLPCKLSQVKELQAERNERAQEIKTDFRLNCDPDIMIEENDVVDVIHEGEIFKLIAGTSFNYQTHKEINMYRRREAMQR